MLKLASSRHELAHRVAQIHIEMKLPLLHHLSTFVKRVLSRLRIRLSVDTAFDAVILPTSMGAAGNQSTNSLCCI